jgi:integrase
VEYFRTKPIDEIDQRAIDEAAAALYPDCSPATHNRQVYTPASAILRYAGVNLDVRRPEPPRIVERHFTHDEAARLLKACAPHHRPLVLFMLMTGARIGEALWLDWRDVDLVRGHVSFTNTKNGESRGVLLNPQIVAALANLPHRDGAVFRKPNGKPYAPLSEDDDRDTSAGTRVGSAFRGAVRRSGIAHCTVHTCRHSWATWHFTLNHDLVALQKLGGWKTLSMVTRYAHAASPESYRAGLNALPSFCENPVKSKTTERKAS